LFTEISPGPDFLNTNLLLFPHLNGWADYDHDGRLDFLVFGYYYTNPAANLDFIAHNNGDGSFSLASNGLTNLVQNGVSSADYDNDGNLDLAFLSIPSGVSGAYPLILHNTGPGQFAPVPGDFPLLSISSDHQIAWGDYDNDGRADFVVSASLSPQTEQLRTFVYRGNGDGTFTDIQAPLPGLSASQVAWQDFDGDGKQDLLLLGWNESNIARIYRNTSDGRFSQVLADFSVAAAGPGFGAIGDFNGDGKPDLIFNTSSNIFINSGQGVFVTNNFGPPPAGQVMAWGDFNNDGRSDLLVSANSNGTNVLRVYQNNGTNAPMTLVAQLGDISSMGNRVAAWGDYNKDGTLDILAWGTQGPVIFRSNYDLTNTVPTAPTNLQVTLAGGNVTFSWGASRDFQTTNSAALTYNLRVGTSANGLDILSPQAELTNGLRLLPASGNVGATNYWTLSDLPRGTYFWSVQAIDSAFAGSPFSTNASFTFPKPVISSIADQFIAPGFNIGPLAFQVWDGETPASNLLVAVSSANTNLIPLANIILGRVRHQSHHHTHPRCGPTRHQHHHADGHRQRRLSGDHDFQGHRRAIRPAR
jgi:hypothetical protein